MTKWGSRYVLPRRRSLPCGALAQHYHPAPTSHLSPTHPPGTRLPLLLNVFYFRETLFIVYELLRDNLYHIYKYIEECKLPRCRPGHRARPCTHPRTPP